MRNDSAYVIVGDDLEPLVYSHLNKRNGWMQARLEKIWNSQTNLICDCKKPGVALRIFYRDDSKKVRRYYLGAIREAHHAHSCFFFGIPKPHLYERPSIVEDDGRYTVQIELPPLVDKRFVRSPKDIEQTEVLPRRRQVKACLPSFNTNGFLRLFWQTTGLNEWRPEWCHFRASHEKVLARIRGCAVQYDLKGCSTLYPSLILEESQMDEFRASNHQFALVVGEISTISTSSSGMRSIDLRGFRSQTVSTFDAAMMVDIFDQLGRPAPAARRWQPEVPEMVWACLLVTRREGKTKGVVFINLVNGSAMRMTEDFVPYDSSFEHNLISRLVADKRHFIKPLLLTDKRLGYGDLSALPEGVLPDLVLLDGKNGVVPMEIWGRKGDDFYGGLPSKKDQVYAESRIHLWQWNPLEQTIPPFPEKAKALQTREGRELVAAARE